MMTPAKYDLPCRAGSTFRKSFSFKDSDGNVLNFTGYTARMHVRLDPESDDPPLVELTTENGRIAISGEEGILELFISDSVTSGFPSETYSYDLELIAPNGDVDCPFYGKFKVTGEVTR
jgi:hypothetical protein